MGMPVVLSDSVTLASGQAKNLDGAKLQPSARRAIRVREILFIIRGPSAAPGTNITGTFGAFMRVKMKMGAHEMMPEPQPIWAMAPPKHWNGQSLNSLAGAFVSGQVATTSFDRWVLPRPMYVPANANVDIVVSRGTDIDPTFVAASFTTRVSLIGEYADKTEESSDVPFISSFFPEAGRMFSNDRELKNTLDRDIEVQRFIGRVFNIDGVTLGGEYITPGSQTVSIRDPQGYAVTGAPYGGFAPFNTVFPWNGRVWNIKRTMKPNQNYSVALGVSPTTLVRPLVSIVASRKERV